MSQWCHNRRNQSLQQTERDRLLPIADGLLKVVDIGLASVIFVGPHLLGGRHLLGWFAILACCIVTAVAWCLRLCLIEKPRWIRHGSFSFIFIGLSGVAFQLIPLPHPWIVALAPSHVSALPVWNGGDTGTPLGQWRTLSISPEDTRLALATLIAYSLLFVTAVQRIRDFNDAKRITGWVATSASVVAVFGIVQYLTANGKFFWFYDHPYADTAGELKAAFTNKNHFAHFLVLGMANLLAWSMLNRNGQSSDKVMHDRWRAHSATQSGKDTRYSSFALGVALALILFAVFASLSRGGILAAASAMGVFVAISARERLLKASHFYAVSALVLVLIAALSLSGSYDMVADRMETFTTSVDSMDSRGARRAIWTANIGAFLSSPMTGWGAGAHRFFYPLFMPEPMPSEFTHAENGYLQIASEAGLPGLLMVTIAIVGCSSWCVRTLRSDKATQPMRIIAGGIAAAMTASLVHSIVDFVWFIPACMATTVMLAACALRLSQLARPSVAAAQSTLTTRLGSFNRVLAVGIAGVWALWTAMPAAMTSLKWDAYVRADQAIQISVEAKATATESRLTELAEAEAINRSALLTNLVEVARGWPNSARAHARLAGALLNQFERTAQESGNSMTVSQVREAADASGFQSPAELREWLSRAFGTNSKLLFLAHREARRALQLCPLQGEAYLYLAELGFLDGQGPDAFITYANQGLRVRPHDASLLFSLGKNYLVGGDIGQALQVWARAFKVAGAHQLHIIEILAGRMSAENFLEVFTPDWQMIGLVWARFRDVGTVEDAQKILSYADAQTRSEVLEIHPARAGRIWHQLAQMQLEMNEAQSALKSLQQSHAVYPDSVAARRLLAKCLMDFAQYEAAESHLRWCAQQHPESKAIRAELLQATRGKMQQMARTTHSSMK